VGTCQSECQARRSERAVTVTGQLLWVDMFKSLRNLDSIFSPCERGNLSTYGKASTSRAHVIAAPILAQPGTRMPSTASLRFAPCRSSSHVACFTVWSDSQS
jgi:hypothetical protein